MPNNRGLGRGFESLIPTDVIEAEFDPTAKGDSGESDGERIQDLDVSLIDPNPHQPRLNFDDSAMAGLADSIRHHGIMQPLIATQAGARYELIAGERRLRAAKLAGLKTVPVIIRSIDDQHKLELALLENLQREDLNAIETATAYRKLVDQFNLPVEEVAKRSGKAPSTVSNTMRLLGLPIEAKRAVVEGRITEGHARQILSVPADHQLELLAMIIDKGWTVRQTEIYVKGLKLTPRKIDKALERVAEANPLTDSLGKYLRAKVSLRRLAKGGKLQIAFKSDAELARIIRAIMESGSKS